MLLRISSRAVAHLLRSRYWARQRPQQMLLAGQIDHAYSARNSSRDIGGWVLLLDVPAMESAFQ